MVVHFRIVNYYFSGAYVVEKLKIQGKRGSRISFLCRILDEEVMVMVDHFRNVKGLHLAHEKVVLVLAVEEVGLERGLKVQVRQWTRAYLGEEVVVEELVDFVQLAE